MAESDPLLRVSLFFNVGTALWANRNVDVGSPNLLASKSVPAAATSYLYLPTPSCSQPFTAGF
jgi:hypothetical protein